MISKFYGNFSEWLTFWNSFDAAIHQNNSLNPIDKFNYLKSHLGGTALNTVEGFALSADNYEKAIKLLKDRFGREDILISRHMNNLLSMRPLKTSSDVRTFRELFDNLSVQIRSLESLNVSIDVYGQLLCPIIIKLLPADLNLELNKELPTGYIINDLITFLERQLTARERSFRNEIGTGNESTSKPNLVNKHPKTRFYNEKPIATASELLNSVHKSNECVFCGKDNHGSPKCDFAANISLNEKRSLMKKKGVCYKCLRPSHLSKFCRNVVRCSICNMSSHLDVMCTKLILDRGGSSKSPTVQDETLANLSTSPDVLLPTLRVTLEGNRTEKTARAIIDTGSQRSYILHSTAMEMEYEQSRREFFRHSLFGGSSTDVVEHEVYTIHLSDINNSYRCEFEALGQPLICGSIPPVCPRSFLEGSEELDVSDLMRDRIEVLIGADVAGRLLTDAQRRISSGLVAIRTKLGWTVMGKIPPTEVRDDTSSLCVTTLLSLDLENLWKLDAIGVSDAEVEKKNQSLQAEMEEHFAHTTTRDIEGRYEVALPWVQDKERIPSNRDLAENQLISVRRKLEEVGDMKEYGQIFEEWMKQGIIEYAREDKLDGVHYLPHRPVYKRNSQTSRIRPVFNASARKRGKLSLNDCLDKGPNLIEIIPILLNTFRKYEVGVSSDIEKAFLQIGIKEEDRDAAVFEIAGVDLTGHFILKNKKKAWIVIFTCAVYRGVHLELVTSLSMEAFLQAFRRFIARRGRPLIVYSDNGTNFKGMANALKKIDFSRLKCDLTLKNITWKFIPPGAPWWGGWWERLIGMMKQLLFRILGQTSLGYEELSRVMCDVESLMNTRPLTYLTEESEDLAPLTPSLFLHEVREVGVPDLDLIDNQTLSRKYQYIKRVREDLRERFRIEYFGILRQETRRLKTTIPFKVGDMVLIGQESLKRLRWPLARIIQLYPGKDWLVRVAKVKTSSGDKIRPIQKLYNLEITPEIRCRDPLAERSPTQEVRLTTEEDPLTSQQEQHHIETPNVVSSYGRPIKRPNRLDLLNFSFPCLSRRDANSKCYKQRHLNFEPSTPPTKNRVRARFTKAFNELETEIKKKKVKKADVEKILRRLQTHHEKLSILNMRMEEALLRESASEDIFTAEYESVCEYEDNFSNIMTDYEALAEKDDVSTISGTVAMNYRLPKLEFKKFGGEPREWITFLSQFSTIDRDPQMPPETKFQYLFQATAENSEAREAVESFPPSADNYPKIIEYIKSRFGEDEMLVEIYVRDLLQNVRAEGKMSVVKLYVRLETQLRALETLGVARDKFEAMLYPLVESALPEDTLRVWERSQYTVSGRGVQDKLTQLMTFLKTEVKGESRVNMAKAAFKIDNNQDAKDDRSNRKSLSKKNTGSKMPTATDLVNTTQMRNNCIFCGNGHPSQECYSGQRMHLPEKKDKAKGKNVCFWCLLPGHGFKKCRIKPRCPVCGGKHYPIMCPTLEAQKTSHLQKAELKVSRESPATKQETANQFTSTTLNNATVGGVYLQTLIVKISGPKGKHNVRVLLDCGSQRSYISKRMVDALGLKRVQQVTLTHNLFGGGEIRQKKHNVYKVNVSSLNNEYMDDLKFLDQEVICGHISQVQDHTILNELKARGINLTDICQGEEISIHMLIGSDLLSSILTGRMQILQNGVVATETKLGWTVMGPAIGKDMEDSCLIVTSFHVNSFDVRDLWKLDVLGIMDAAETKSRKDLIEASNTHFKETVKRDESGRYIVSLPWIAGHPPIPVNRRTTENRLLTTTRNVQGKMLYEKYDTIFEEWEKERFIEEVEDKWEECSYLPHRPVLKDSHTTPIRPVFDASCKKKGLPSLNQCLEKGDNLIELIPDFLLRFRLGKYGIIADMRKAFLQIQVREEDREFLRFLWWKKDQKTLKFYRHCRVVFGLTSSPFLLAATIKYHLSLPQFQDNRCAELLARSFYVDNCILSLSSTHDVKKIIKESSDIMMQAKFELRDWMWNEPGITEQDPASILGMEWHLQTDTIAINVQSLKNIDEEKSITKRKLIVKSVHEKMYHCGAQTLRSVLREKFWIPKARQLVRHVIHKCPRCRRFETKRVDVPEASLPQHRVRDVVVFEVTGIDLGGPLCLEDGQKVWFVIFTCGVYRAVHLELVTSLSTEALVGAVERFVARRGCPAVIYSDNGTNLVGLRNELYRVNFGVKWKLNPPAAPWWEGWIERIVGLTKKLLRRLLGKRVVNYEEMVTILENCERVINARPLTYIAEDNDDLVPLTPEMFLREPRTEGEIDLNEFRCNFGKSYEKRKRLLKEFRKRFRSEYLGLLVHHDNRKKQRQLKIGDIVLVEVENRKQINWPMGKITKVFPGTDNVRRLVEDKTKSGFMKRAVQRLFPLEVPSEDVEQGDGELKPAEDEIVREKTPGVESVSVQEKTTPVK
ncbi:hypothetical protein LAZ67_7000025, partial [Cordylochernes scorpioides]